MLKEDITEREFLFELQNLSNCPEEPGPRVLGMAFIFLFIVNNYLFIYIFKFCSILLFSFICFLQRFGYQTNINFLFSMFQQNPTRYYDKVSNQYFVFSISTS